MFPLLAIKNICYNNNYYLCLNFITNICEDVFQSRTSTFHDFLLNNILVYQFGRHQDTIDCKLFDDEV